MHRLKKYLNKKTKDFTNSSDFDDEEIPTIQISSPPLTPSLQNMDTVDDIDEDEAFINELMALHPNDEDIIVEDIENLPPPSIEEAIIDHATVSDINDAENDDDDNNNVDDGVRI